MDTETKRTIRTNNVLELGIVSPGTGSDVNSHIHANKIFLDRINIDNKQRLIYNNAIINIPVLEETW